MALPLPPLNCSSCFFFARNCFRGLGVSGHGTMARCALVPGSRPRKQPTPLRLSRRKNEAEIQHVAARREFMAKFLPGAAK